MELKWFKNKDLSKIFVDLSIIIFSLVTILYLFTSNIIWLIIILGLTFLIASNQKIKKFWIILLIISFCIRLIFILVAKFPQFADFQTLLEASNMFAAGDYSFNSWWHFHTWGYQTGFVIYQGILLKLFNSVFLLKLLNIIYSSCLVLFIYFMGKKISSERSARIVSLLYMIFPFPLFLNQVLANHHLSCLLMYLGIMFLIKKEKKYKDYLIGGALVSFGNIIRPEGIIVVVSFLIYELLLHDKLELKKTIIRIISFLIIYFSIGYMASFLVVKSGINPSGLKNNDPLWKFVLGFNYNTCGYYDDTDSQYQINKETEIAIIKERALGDLGRTSKLMLCKINRFWLSSGLELENGYYIDKTFDIGKISIKFSTLENLAIKINSYIYLSTFFAFII